MTAGYADHVGQYYTRLKQPPKIVDTNRATYCTSTVAPGVCSCMKLTSDLFADFLKCPTKCYLHSTGQAGTSNAYADWLREQNDAYRSEAAQTLMAALPEGERAITAPGAANLRTATWRLAVDLHVETETIASRLHAIERVPPQGRGRPAQFIAVRFTFFNKLTKDDRLLLAFDALVLSEVLGREVSVGKIIHGGYQAALKVGISGPLKVARKLIGKITALLTDNSPPDLALNHHCNECEFQASCRQKAVEKDGCLKESVNELGFW